MTDIKYYIEICVLVIALLIVAYFEIKKLLPLFKNKAFWEQLPTWIIEAETKLSDGNLKMEYVLDKATKYCKKNNIELSTKNLSKIITKLVDMTKQVNV